MERRSEGIVAVAWVSTDHFTFHCKRDFGEGMGKMGRIWAQQKIQKVVKIR